MKLRIIAGRFKRRVLNVPSSASDFRPTKDMVRESLSNILAGRIRDAEVADICCGSGAFGLEMVSRGAKSCDFIDSSRSRCNNLEKQLMLLGLEKGEYNIQNGDVEKIFSRYYKSYDIIFYDPPYNIEGLAKFAPSLFSCIKPGGILVYEREWKKGNCIPHIENALEPDVRKFGQTEVISWAKPVE